jgi:hypothetical protein
MEKNERHLATALLLFILEKVLFLFKLRRPIEIGQRMLLCMYSRSLRIFSFCLVVPLLNFPRFFSFSLVLLLRKDDSSKRK